MSSVTARMVLMFVSVINVRGQTFLFSHSDAPFGNRVARLGDKSQNGGDLKNNFATKKQNLQLVTNWAT